MRRGLAVAATPLLCLLALALLTGCGSSSADSEAPQRCIDRWNEDEVARTLGEHAYGDHEIRRVSVEEIRPPADAKDIRAKRTCLVVFDAQEGDPEEGSLGLVITRFGWSQLFELGYDDEELIELQRSAGDDANAGVFPDGTLG